MAYTVIVKQEAVDDAAEAFELERVILPQRTAGGLHGEHREITIVIVRKPS